ncbi:MAG TPA: choice-of-anchor D domain-containing protein [Myxococcales bacterium LLY-WYZ-16_1]|nr:choice-of-anchor D domain-containing protein [Myxococcales bacterium LLY-WYZ-16_1]
MTDRSIVGRGAVFTLVCSLAGAGCDTSGQGLGPGAFRDGAVSDADVDGGSGSTDGGVPTVVRCDPGVEFVAEPGDLGLGQVLVGTTRTATWTVSHSNRCTLRLEISATSEVPACGAGDPAPFCLETSKSLESNPFVDVPPQSSAEIVVRFRPDRPGPVGAFARLRGAGGPQVELALRGSGIDTGFACVPAVDFGLEAVGRCAERPVTCFNRGNRPLRVVEALADAPFGLEAPLPQVLDAVAEPGGAQELVELSVRFCPEREGAFEGRLVLRAEEEGRPVQTEVALFGSALGQSIDVDVAEIDFGDTSVDVPSYHSVTLRNVGTQSLRFDEIIPDADGTGRFTINQGSFQATLDPGGRMTVLLRFDPVDVGPVQSTLRIRSTDPVAPEIDIPLRGEGIDAPGCLTQQLPSRASFVKGSIRRVFRVLNRSTTQNCLVSSARLAGFSDLAFSLVGGELRSVFIPPGESLDLRIEFDPTRRGRFWGALEVSMASPVGPMQRVELNGFH